MFLSVFDWTLHKGWDVLLRAVVETFRARDDVRLLLKVWSSLGYGPAGSGPIPPNATLVFVVDLLSIG